MWPILESAMCHMPSKNISLYSHNPLNDLNNDSLVMVLPATLHDPFPHPNARLQCTHANQQLPLSEWKSVT